MRSDARKRAADHTPGSGELTEEECQELRTAPPYIDIGDDRTGVERVVERIIAERESEWLTAFVAKDAWLRERARADCAEAALAQYQATDPLVRDMEDELERRRADEDGLRAIIEAAIDNWPLGSCAHRCFREDEHIAPKDCLYGPDWLAAILARHAAEPGAQEAG